MRILTLVHNHSSLHPGGTELIAEAMHKAYGSRKDVTARWLLAAQDPGLTTGFAGTTISTLPGHDDVFLFRYPGFDPVGQSRYSLEPLLFDVTWLLDELQPDVVHIHHLNYFGIEMLGLLRRRLPEAKIILTLHDYYFICSNDGLLMTPDGAPCGHVHGRMCRCNPDFSPAETQSKRLNILQHLALADHIVAPSRFLMDQFLNWGVPARKMTLIRHGWPPVGFDDLATPDPTRFAIIGNLRPNKGTLLAMEAFMLALAQTDEPLQLDIWGAALYQPDSVKDAIVALADKSKGAIRLHGKYTNDALPRALTRAAWVLVPSLWWENAPLVIAEAFAAGRPVLCSDIGGMAEAVSDGVDGRHVPVGDVVAWAETIAELGGNAKAWQKLNQGIKPSRRIDDMVGDYLTLCRQSATKAA